MKFSEIPYVRPDVEQYRIETTAKIEAFKQAPTAEAQLELWREIDQDDITFWTKQSLVFVRNSLNTADPVMEEEQAFWDEVAPTLEELSAEFRRAVLTSQFREELLNVFGATIFSIYELKEKTFKPVIVEDMQLDNALGTEYTKLVGGANFEFQGETHNLSSIWAYLSEQDRNLRHQAIQTKAARYEANDKTHNDLYDRMVQVRHAQARKLGYKNYVQYGYDCMGRVDYTSEQIADFREFVVRYIVPLCNDLYTQQASYLGVEKLYYHDEEVLFPEGNPKPIWTPEELLTKAQRMYHELSPETGKFFDLMQQQEMFDVITRQGKTVGGYCIWLSAYRMPFIFANFNWTTDDIDVLTHEVGHAFQNWNSFDQPLQAYYWPTMEGAEIHSMSMEFLTMPWMKEFFREKALRYEYLHLVNAIKFWPYACAVDEFQQRVYEQVEHPTHTYEQIRQELEKKYLPHRLYHENSYLQKGNQWKRKAHIFVNPLYYIDYALAQICAFQFRIKSQNNFAEARKDYTHLCKLGGSKSFLALVDEANLSSPFEPSTIEKVMTHAQAWLAKHPLEKI